MHITFTTPPANYVANRWRNQPRDWHLSVSRSFFASIRCPCSRNCCKITFTNRQSLSLQPCIPPCCKSLPPLPLFLPLSYMRSSSASYALCTDICEIFHCVHLRTSSLRQNRMRSSPSSNALSAGIAVDSRVEFTNGRALSDTIGCEAHHLLVGCLQASPLVLVSSSRTDHRLLTFEARSLKHTLTAAHQCKPFAVPLCLLLQT